jgi:hypothetical protein
MPVMTGGGIRRLPESGEGGGEVGQFGKLPFAVSSAFYVGWTKQFVEIARGGDAYLPHQLVISA